MSCAKDNPCGPRIVHPRAITNPPSLEQIAYRVGDFTTFRDALLRPIEGETELAPDWRPGPDDLGLQLVEWSALLFDVLTFYSERWMQGTYLRTAEQDEHVRRLVRFLGYRCRPAIAARGRLAADVSAPITLPKGFAFQSKPSPGEEPQIFELDVETTLTPLSAVVALPSGSGSLTDGDGDTIWVRGRLSNVKVGDMLLVVPRKWAGEANYAWSEVAALEPDKDALGKAATRVRFAEKLALTGAAGDFQLMRSTQSAQAWPYGVAGNHEGVGERTVHFAALTRDIRVGDRVLLDASQARDLFFLEPVGTAFSKERESSTLGFNIAGGVSIGVALPERGIAPPTALYTASSTAEEVWFANGQDGDPTKPPTDPKIPAVPILHSVIRFDRAIGGNLRDRFRLQLSFHHGWRDVGELIEPPVRFLQGGSDFLRSVGAMGFSQKLDGPVLLEGSDGKGVPATLTVQSASQARLSDLPINDETLAAPIKVWKTLLPVSRGQTVEREVLGNGDSRVLGQAFVLRKKPLTYLPTADPDVGRLYTSTLRVWVDGVQCKEVSHFHGQHENAPVYVTNEDDAGKTHVRFATRLPTGENNIVAAYRYGGGAADPAVGSLTMILQPRDGLRSVRNPVRMGGGADPQAADELRRYAPQSVLTFDRAVSADDYEAIAAQAPSVTRARAYWRFDPTAQCGKVTVYVGDDQEAVVSARAALRDTQDPNRPATVELAMPVPMHLALSVKVAPNHVAADVLDDLRGTLLDPDRGLFGTQASRIGRALFDSELSAACLAVRGVQAVQLRKFSPIGSASGYSIVMPRTMGKLPPCAGHRHNPGVGKFFTLASPSLQLDAEAGNVT